MDNVVDGSRDAKYRFIHWLSYQLINKLIDKQLFPPNLIYPTMFYLKNPHFADKWNSKGIIYTLISLYKGNREWNKVHFLCHLLAMSSSISRLSWTWTVAGVRRAANASFTASCRVCVKRGSNVQMTRDGHFAKTTFHALLGTWAQQRVLPSSHFIFRLNYPPSLLASSLWQPRCSSSG